MKAQQSRSGRCRTRDRLFDVDEKAFLCFESVHNVLGHSLCHGVDVYLSSRSSNPGPDPGVYFVSLIVVVEMRSILAQCDEMVICWLSS